jgi:hypothetical protein
MEFAFVARSRIASRQITQCLIDRRSMTTTRILLAGGLGAIAMFIWSAIAHMALPLGHAGIHNGLPNEEKVLAALQSELGDKAGLYLFPGSGVGDNPTHEQEKEAFARYPEKLAANPSGLLMYHPAGSRPMAIGQLLTVEFLKQLLVSILAVFLLAQTRIASFGGRVGFVLVVGIVAAITTNISYWNWYGFPSAYTAPYMTIEIVGFLCAGLAVALVLKSQKAEG